MNDLLEIGSSMINRKIDDIDNKIHSGVVYDKLRKLDDGKEIKEVTSKDKLIWSALGGLMGLAISGGVSKVLKYNKATSIPMMMGMTGLGIGAGYSASDFENTVKKHNVGLISDEDAKKEVLRLKHPGDYTYNSLSDLGSTFVSPMNKEAGIIGSTLGFIGKASVKVPFKFGQGLFNRGATTKWGQKALTYSSRGVAAGGMIYGGYKGIQALKEQRSGSDYTTHLRNNLLKGSIKPENLGQQDLIAVRKLGMK